MKEYNGKTIDECLLDASSDLGLDVDELVYEVVEEKKTLLKKTATIKVYELSDAADYAKDYLINSLKGLGVEATVDVSYEENVIKLTLNSERNPVLIGKNGTTLQSFNELTKLAVSNKFRHRYRVLLDVAGYKEDKYSRITYLAKKNAKMVQKSRVSVKLDPMSPDERRIIHNALSGMDHIKTESVGEGKNRAVTIKYVD